MKKSIILAVTSALITAAAIKAAPALAEPAVPEVEISMVRTADLNLKSPSGVKQLDNRLIHAVREVCGEASDVDLAGKNQVRACREETLAQARAQRDGMLIAARRGATIAITASR